MSHASTPDAVTPRQARQLTKKFTAMLTGKERGPDRAVRRDSYDVDDRRAQVFRPIGDGSREGALGWIDCLLQVAREYDDHERQVGGARPLGWTAITVLEILLGRRGRQRIPIDFKSGRLDPAIDTIATAAGLARITVVRALARLRAKGFLTWVRRSRKIGSTGTAGPQREQTSNAYFFDLAEMPKRVKQRLRDLLARKARARANRAGEAPPPSPAAIGPQDSLLRSALNALGEKVLSASTPGSPAIPVQA